METVLKTLKWDIVFIIAIIANVIKTFSKDMNLSSGKQNTIPLLYRLWLYRKKKKCDKYKGAKVDMSKY